MQGRPRREAIKGAKKKPRDSRQTRLEILERLCVEVIWVARCATRASVASGSRKMGNISAKNWP